MNTTFQTAPLVEIIAELRWMPPHLEQGEFGPGMPMPLFTGSKKFEEFFMQFGGACYQHGFQRAERLMPSEVPMMPFQPVYRYRKADGGNSSMLQVGPGLFTANAVPPYKSWTEFEPDVRNGVQALLNSRTTEEKATPMTSVSLRYIDAFDASYFSGMSTSAFIQNVLGFVVAAPPCFAQRFGTGATPNVFARISAPTTDGMLLNVTVGEGHVNNAQAVVLDTTVATMGETAADVDSIMTALNAARGVIHQSFLEISKPLHGLMKPTGRA